MICKHCNTEIPDSAYVCTNCGTYVKRKYTPRKRFTKEFIICPEAYYSPIQRKITTLYNKMWDRYDTKGWRAEITDRYTKVSLGLLVHLGYDNFTGILNAIYNTNKGFYKLLKEDEAECALALIRIQLENLLALFIETLYPFRILNRVLAKGEELGKVTIDGVQIKPSECRKKLDSIYPGISDLNKKYTGFVHTSKAMYYLMEVRGKWGSGQRKYSTKEKDFLAVDMVQINQIIGNLFWDYYHRLKSGEIQIDNSQLYYITQNPLAVSLHILEKPEAPLSKDEAREYFGKLYKSGTTIHLTEKVEAPDGIYYGTVRWCCVFNESYAQEYAFTLPDGKSIAVTSKHNYQPLELDLEGSKWVGRCKRGKLAITVFPDRAIEKEIDNILQKK